MARLDDYGLAGLVLTDGTNTSAEDKRRWELTQSAIADYKSQTGKPLDLGEFYKWLRMG